MTNAPPPALRLVGLHKNYAGEQAALSDLDLEVTRGRLVGLVGPNGSGKSTLLGLCAGVLRPSRGRVETLGFTPYTASGVDRGRIGFTPQDVALDPDMTGLEAFQLLAALNRLTASNAASKLDWLREGLGLGSVLRRRVSTYSGGMRRRLHLGLSLSSRAELLLLDEPFVGLDAETSSRVWDCLVERARDGATVLVATHELFDAGERCHDVCVLSRGHLVAFAPPATLRERHAALGATRSSFEAALRELLRQHDPC